MKKFFKEHYPEIITSTLIILSIIWAIILMESVSNSLSDISEVGLKTCLTEIWEGKAK